MDDLSEKLSALLSDPEGMERVRAMAEGLLGTSPTKEKESSPDLGDIDIGAITRIMGLINKNRGDDSRVRLLMALKPNLSPERQGRVDSAVKILKLIELAPLLKEAGLFNL
ncbi:MAG: hypothetical protein UIG59_03495 [Acutalibacteraceae bacterium]|nr:hypothetical protein [Acutalibacteraceae bacterium]